MNIFVQKGSCSAGARFGKLVLLGSAVVALLSCHISASPLLASDEVADAYIKARVAQELGKKSNKKMGWFGKKSGDSVEQVDHVRFHAKEQTQKSYVYKLPSLPFYSIFYEQKDFLQLAFSLDTASQAYSSNGRSKDLSIVRFGEEAITIQDILLVSKLINRATGTDGSGSSGDVAALQASSIFTLPTGFTTLSPLSPGAVLTKNEYFLGILADQPVIFDASQVNASASINYARHYRGGDISVGFNIPVVLKSHKLELTSDISSTRLAKINNTDTRNAGRQDINFSANYGDSFEDFFVDILNRKGIGFNKKGTTVGMSDVTGYFNLELQSRHCHRCVIGATLLLPTAREQDIAKLWNDELGNGGFTELGAFGSIFWEKNRWFNPHVHAKATYVFAANVNRRVPQIKNFNGSNSLDGKFANNVTVGSGAFNLVFGENVRFKAGKDFKELDSTTRGFADGIQKVKIRKGAELFIRLGNMFDRVLSHKGFFEIYYDFNLKGRDYLASRRNDDVFKPDLLMHNSWSIAHKLSADYSYQFDKNYRGRLGGNYVVAGRNTPKSWGLDLAINMDF